MRDENQINPEDIIVVEEELRAFLDDVETSYNSSVVCGASSHMF